MLGQGVCSVLRDVGWGGSSVSQVLVQQAWGPELEPQNAFKNHTGCGDTRLNFSAEKAEREGRAAPWNPLNRQLVCLASVRPVTDPVSKTK